MRRCQDKIAGSAHFPHVLCSAGVQLLPRHMTDCHAQMMGSNVPPLSTFSNCPRLQWELNPCTIGLPQGLPWAFEISLYPAALHDLPRAITLYPCIALVIGEVVISKLIL